jgi:hypothetical protein
MADPVSLLHSCIVIARLIAQVQADVRENNAGRSARGNEPLRVNRIESASKTHTYFIIYFFDLIFALIATSLLVARAAQAIR